jgi:glycosyltransferase involved in cell wall biosynthesis
MEIQMPYGDGFNLGLLEAMSMGMAVVTLYNPTSPIRHKENGLVAHSTEELVVHLRTLLQDKDKRLQLGKQAKITVHERFNLSLFVEKWNAVFLSAATIEN